MCVAGLPSPHSLNLEGDSAMTIYTQPFTYLVGWSEHKTFYYGVRFKIGCGPSDLWTSYFTSSKYVKDFRFKFGEPDIIQIRKVFESIDEARNWEHKVLRRIKVATRQDFLNKTDNKCWPDNRGLKRSEEFKKHLSRLFKGKKLTEEHKRKIAIGNSGKRPASFGAAVSAGMVGVKYSKDTIEKRRLAQIGLKRSKEFCDRLREVNAMSVKVVDPSGNIYKSLAEASQATGLQAKKIGVLSKRSQQGWSRL